MSESKTCPQCKSEVPKSAKKCKHCSSDVRNWFRRHPIISLFLFMMVLGLILPDQSSKPVPKKNPIPFEKVSMDRFAQVEKQWKAEGESIADVMGLLNNIDCSKDNCTRSVNMNFTYLPNDFQIIGRGQASNFSRQKTEYGEIGEVQVNLILNGKRKLTCYANQGIVSRCE